MRRAASAGRMSAGPRPTKAGRCDAGDAVERRIGREITEVAVRLAPDEEDPLAHPVEDRAEAAFALLERVLHLDPLAERFPQMSVLPGAAQRGAEQRAQQPQHVLVRRAEGVRLRRIDLEHAERAAARTQRHEQHRARADAPAGIAVHPVLRLAVIHAQHFAHAGAEAGDALVRTEPQAEVRLRGTLRGGIDHLLPLDQLHDDGGRAGEQRDLLNDDAHHARRVEPRHRNGLLGAHDGSERIAGGGHILKRAFHVSKSVGCGYGEAQTAHRCYTASRRMAHVQANLPRAAGFQRPHGASVAIGSGGPVRSTNPNVFA